MEPLAGERCRRFASAHPPEMPGQGQAARLACRSSFRFSCSITRTSMAVLLFLPVILIRSPFGGVVPLAPPSGEGRSRVVIELSRFAWKRKIRSLLRREVLAQLSLSDGHSVVRGKKEAGTQTHQTPAGAFLSLRFLCGCLCTGSKAVFSQPIKWELKFNIWNGCLSIHFYLLTLIKRIFQYLRIVTDKRFCGVLVALEPPHKPRCCIAIGTV